MLLFSNLTERETFIIKSSLEYFSAHTCLIFLFLLSLEIWCFLSLPWSCLNETFYAPINTFICNGVSTISNFQWVKNVRLMGPWYIINVRPMPKSSVCFSGTHLKMMSGAGLWKASLWHACKDVNHLIKREVLSLRSQSHSILFLTIRWGLNLAKVCMIN